VILSTYKAKGDPMECGSYRGIKFLEHAMKVLKSIFEFRITQEIDVDDMQSGFMKCKTTIDAIFVVRLTQKNLELKERRSILAL